MKWLWMVPLTMTVIAFLAYALPPYLTLDPARSRIPVPAHNPAYYDMLVLHIAFGATAMTTGALQLWFGLKGSHPSLHRLIGRIYIFCGVLPAGVLAIGLGAMSPFGPVIVVSDITLALLWLTATMTGYGLIRSGRAPGHRRWMVRSYVLTLSIISNRLWFPLAAMVWAPHLATAFQGNEVLMYQMIAGISGWLGWVLPLIFAEWTIIGRLSFMPKFYTPVSEH